MGATDDLDARLFSPDHWVNGNPPAGRQVASVEDRTEGKNMTEVHRADSEGMLKQAQALVEQLDELRVQRSKLRALKEHVALKDMQYAEAYNTLANSGRVGEGDSEAFQVGGQVVVVLCQKSGPAVIKVMSLTAPPPVFPIFQPSTAEA